MSPSCVAIALSMAACARVGRVAALRMSRGDNLLVSSCTPPLVLSMHWHWLSLPAVRCGGIATVGVVPDPCRARALLSAALLVRLTPCRHALAALAALSRRRHMTETVPRLWPG